MRNTNELYIPIPKVRNTHCKVEIAGDDMTKYVKESLWVKPCNEGIGTFKIVIFNAKGQFTEKYSPGDIVKFYADNLNATRLQFWGRIDYIKYDLSSDGQFLEIEGRHRAYLSSEFLVCYSTALQSTSDILKAIIDRMPASYGFTYTNVGDDSHFMDVEWNYKPFWDCVNELCNYAQWDCYVDENLDFHYFKANSILNSEEAISEGDNFISVKEWGTNTYYEKTRVTVMGQDVDGLPIVYTAIDPNEGDDIRELFIKDTSANTEKKVKDLADSKLSEFIDRPPQAITESYGLETLNPGDNLWILVPRQKIAGQYKAYQITHKFGSSIGGWRTVLNIEKEDVGIGKMLQTVSKKSELGIENENVNKLNYSVNFNFSDESKTYSHASTQLLNSKLILDSDVATEGTWISTLKTTDDNITGVEIRADGKDIWGSEFYFSVNNGNDWQQIDVDDFNNLIAPALSGNQLRIKVKLVRVSGWNLNPEVESLVLLYS